MCTLADEVEPVYFFADPPHLFKSLRTCLLNNDILLAPDVVRKYELSTE